MEKKLNAQELQEKIGEYDIKKSKLMEEYKKCDYEQQCLLTKLNEEMIAAYKKQAAGNGLLIPNGGKVKMGNPDINLN